MPLVEMLVLAPTPLPTNVAIKLFLCAPALFKIIPKLWEDVPFLSPLHQIHIHSMTHPNDARKLHPLPFESIYKEVLWGNHDARDFASPFV